MNKSKYGCRLSVAALAVFLACAVSGCQDSQQAAKPQEAAAGGNPQRGKALIVQYGCKSCHAIDGIAGPDGAVGPPLNDIKSRSYIAGVLTNTPDHIRQWIMNPAEVKPGTAMPDLGVTEEQAQDIAAFLYSQ